MEELPESIMMILADLFAVAVLAYLWVPIAFFAFALGRKRFGMKFLLALMTVEAVLLGFWMVVPRVITIY